MQKLLIVFLSTTLLANSAFTQNFDLDDDFEVDEEMTLGSDYSDDEEDFEDDAEDDKSDYRRPLTEKQKKLLQAFKDVMNEKKQQSQPWTWKGIATAVGLTAAAAGYWFSDAIKRALWPQGHRVGGVIPRTNPRPDPKTPSPEDMRKKTIDGLLNKLPSPAVVPDGSVSVFVPVVTPQTTAEQKRQAAREELQRKKAEELSKDQAARQQEAQWDALKSLILLAQDTESLIAVVLQIMEIPDQALRSRLLAEVKWPEALNSQSELAAKILQEAKVAASFQGHSAESAAQIALANIKRWKAIKILSDSEILKARLDIFAQLIARAMQTQSQMIVDDVMLLVSRIILPEGTRISADQIEEFFAENPNLPGSAIRHLKDVMARSMKMAMLEEQNAEPSVDEPHDGSGDANED